MGDDYKNDFLDEENEDQEDFSFEPEPDFDTQKSSADDGANYDTRKELAVKILQQLTESLSSVVRLLEGGASSQDAARQLTELVTCRQEAQEATGASGYERQVIEGIFDGRGMVGPDGKLYNVPPNYASKSRLVEGDVLKLTIKSDGTFLFKQIKPVDRKRCKGKLAFDEERSCYYVVCDDGTFRALDASVTYYKGSPGDEVVILVPKSGKCVWAAVENIVKK